MTHIRSNGYDLIVEEYEYKNAVYLQIEDMDIGAEFVFKYDNEQITLEKPEKVYGGLPKYIESFVRTQFNGAEIAL